MKNNEPNRLGLPGGGEWHSHTASSTNSNSLVTGFERWLARRVAKYLGDPPVSIALWDGENAYRPNVRAVGRMTFRDRGALWSAVASPVLGMGDAYSEGRLEVSGDLVEVLFHIFRGIAKHDVNAFKRSLLGRLPRARSNTLRRARLNIQHHYDVGNDFYRLWLDENMVYTCAYYPSPEATLEEAQIAKMDHVCRKVMLKPGMSVIEAGCGWGALALHMARNYGVDVKAFNISPSQIAYARARANKEGLSDRVEFVEDDYRNCSGKFDAFVSVGMLEHVGPDHYAEFGRVINRVLKKEGLGIIHSVGRSRPTAPNAWLEQRIFPGSYPPSLREMMYIFEPYDFSIMDVENLRLHYARTLMEWLERFDRNVDVVRELYDETFVRAWRLYLAGCAAAFLASANQLFQIVFAFPQHNAVPMSREYLYGAAATPAWRFD